MKRRTYELLGYESTLSTNDKSHREFIKAIISIETDVEDEDRLNRLYDFYMEDDDMSLLNYALVE